MISGEKIDLLIDLFWSPADTEAPAPNGAPTGDLPGDPLGELDDRDDRRMTSEEGSELGSGGSNYGSHGYSDSSGAGCSAAGSGKAPAGAAALLLLSALGLHRRRRI